MYTTPRGKSGNRTGWTDLYVRIDYAGDGGEAPRAAIHRLLAARPLAVADRRAACAEIPAEIKNKKYLLIKGP